MYYRNYDRYIADWHIDKIKQKHVNSNICKACLALEQDSDYQAPGYFRAFFFVSRLGAFFSLDCTNLRTFSFKSCDAINAQLERKMQSRRRVRHANGHGTSNDFAKVLLRVAFLAVLLSVLHVDGISSTQGNQLNLNQTAMSVDKYTTAMRCSVDELGMPELQVRLSDVSQFPVTVVCYVLP